MKISMKINRRFLGILVLFLGMQLTTVARQVPEMMSSLPATFRQTQANQIIGSDLLTPFFEKIRKADRPVRVLHLGDSHVRGHVFTVETRQCLEKVWGDSAVYADKITYKTSALARETGKAGLVYHAYGINGATYGQFNNEQTLSKFDELNPDLIILSFGTNEAHGRNYTEEWQIQEMDALLASLKERFPAADFLLTTPPGSYWRKRVKKTLKNGRKTYVTRHILNEQVELVANTQVTYGAEHQIPVWDLYHVVGGADYACRNWRNAGLQRSDYIHYTSEGYILQGKLLAEAILKAYYSYETNIL